MQHRLFAVLVIAFGLMPIDADSLGIQELQIDVAGFPTVQLELRVWDESLGTGDPPQVTLHEDGQLVPGLEWSSEAASASVAVVFLVDTSGSMKGTPFEQAKQAIATLAGQSPESVSFALARFDDQYDGLSERDYWRY